MARKSTPSWTRYVNRPGSTRSISTSSTAATRPAQGVTKTPEQIIDEVKKSGLRGRGGAGFPTGMKWGFVPKESPKPGYLCMNADEYEPGTFKDREMMEDDPHLLLEGSVIACHRSPSRSPTSTSAVRVYRVSADARGSPMPAGRPLGKNILGHRASDCDIYIHRGAGAYIGGEETGAHRVARGQARYPRMQAAVPRGRRTLRDARRSSTTSRRSATCRYHREGRRLVRRIGPEKNTGAEAVLRQRPRREAGRVRGADGHDAAPADLRLRGRHPRRSEAQGDHPRRLLDARVLPDELDAQVSFDGLVAAGSMLGSAAIIVMDETTDMVWACKT